ncbi:MAG: thiamine biosynthesis lipoprotein [Flavobacteriales bacterium]|jgi:thiamine biosynthesis lipoprotein
MILEDKPLRKRLLPLSFFIELCSMKRTSAYFIALAVCTSALIACNSSEQPDDAPNQKASETVFQETVIHGEAQGTTYTIRYLENDSSFKGGVDSILFCIDQDLSTWVPTSLINRMNAHDRTDTVFAFYDSTKYFSVLFDVSREIWQQTDGAFDPTVYPLVELWGFGLKNKGDVTPEAVAEQKTKVSIQPSNIDMIEIESGYIYKETQIRKGQAGVRLDFNAIAQGFSVDVIAEYLERQNISNYMIELGGELLCKGVNSKGNDWRIAIDRPVDEIERSFQAILNVRNKAVATSGSYRKFFEEDGKKYSHAIDPRTGYPVQHSLLSATVMASNCMLADAYATAFLVMGVDDTKRFLEEHRNLGLDVYLIYDNNGSFESWMTEGIKKQIEELMNT